MRWFRNRFRMFTDRSKMCCQLSRTPQGEAKISSPRPTLQIARFGPRKLHRFLDRFFIAAVQIACTR